MLQSKSLQMMLNSSPIIFAMEKRLSNYQKVNYIFCALSENDQESLIGKNSYTIGAFNILCDELLGKTIEINTIDRYRRQITSAIRAKRLRENDQVNLDIARSWKTDTAV